MQLVLASTSRFRRELLARTGLQFHCVAPLCDETPLAHETAAATAQRLAANKAASLRAHYPQALIVGSDQVASLDGKHLGKPDNLEHAHTMLRALSGRALVFYTALTLLDSARNTQQHALDVTTVHMRHYNDAHISRYLAREPDALYCAGSCKSEGLGSVLIERIESTDPNALIGLPLLTLTGWLLNADIEIL